MPNDKKAYAQREKAYMQGKLFPQIKVGMTKVNLTPTVVKDERGIPHTEPNAPVYIYDTSGPYSDPNYQVDLRRVLLDREQTEEKLGRRTCRIGHHHQPHRLQPESLEL